MMRTIRATRNLGDPRAVDVQTLITERPVTCVSYRTTVSRMNDSNARTAVATFEGRIDASRSSGADVRTSHAGHEVDVLFLLTTCYSTDSSARTIDFAQGDEIEAGGNTYIVTSKIPWPSYKLEGVLRLKE